MDRFDDLAQRVLMDCQVASTFGADADYARRRLIAEALRTAHQVGREEGEATIRVELGRMREERDEARKDLDDSLREADRLSRLVGRAWEATGIPCGESSRFASIVEAVASLRKVSIQAVEKASIDRDVARQERNELRTRVAKAEAALEEARSEAEAHNAAATQYEKDITELRAKLAEAESYGRANGFREGLRTLGGDDDVYERAIATWGPTAQLGMVQEECAELIAAIHRRQRGRCSAEDVAEEAADVWIMLEQIIRILGHELVAEALDRKLARLRSRLDASPHRTEAGR